jgi:hypothetical protein
MRLIEYLILEARKNPTTNIKQDTMQELKSILRRYPDAFVSFTHIPKFGINPSSPYNTPIGLYAYKLEDVVGFLTSIDNIHKTFAADFKYIQVFTVDPSAYIWTLTNNSINKDVQQKIITSQKSRGFKTGGFSRATTDKKLWFAIYKFIDPDFKTEEEDENSSTKGVESRKILKQAGIDGVIDPGLGIIHPNEPDQAVFFNIKQLHHLAMLENKLSKNLKRDRINRILTNPNIPGYATLYDVYTTVYEPASDSRQKQLLPVLQQAALKLIQTIKVPDMSAANLILKLLPPETPFTGPAWKAVEHIYAENPYYLLLYAKSKNARLPPALEQAAKLKLNGGYSWREYKDKFNIKD